MQNLSQLLRRPLQEVRTKTVVFVLVVALVGFADASYLTVEHFRGVVPPCTITAGCEQVLTSPYATPLGIPVSLLGALYYLTIAVGSFMYLESKHAGALRSHHSSILKWTLLLTIVGIIASLWFVYLQVFIIHSYCAYCLGSAATSIILFVAAMDIFSRYETPAGKLI